MAVQSTHVGLLVTDGSCWLTLAYWVGVSHWLIGDHSGFHVGSLVISRWILCWLIGDHSESQVALSGSHVGSLVGSRWLIGDRWLLLAHVGSLVTAGSRWLTFGHRPLPLTTRTTCASLRAAPWFPPGTQCLRAASGCYMTHNSTAQLKK